MDSDLFIFIKYVSAGRKGRLRTAERDSSYDPAPHFIGPPGAAAGSPLLAGLDIFTAGGYDVFIVKHYNFHFKRFILFHIRTITPVLILL